MRYLILNLVIALCTMSCQSETGTNEPDANVAGYRNKQYSFDSAGEHDLPGGKRAGGLQQIFFWHRR